MGRMPVAAERLTSQRATAEFREKVAESSELQRKLEQLEAELHAANKDRSYWKREKERLDAVIKDAEPPTLDGKRSAIAKLKSHASKNFYEHAGFLKDCLLRFDSEDIAALWVTTLSLVEKDRGVDFHRPVLKSNGFRSATREMIHAHELAIRKHLSDTVYTSDHFSLLRLVGGISKRVCGLIEQSIKWAHSSDGSKKRQTIHPDSDVPAPTLFGLKEINESEARAEKESGLTMQDHTDRKGADICGKPHALDRAMRDSLAWTSRSGGMATKGSKDDPHLMCITGDGAGLTAGKSGVRVGHFPGSTNYLNQSSLDFTNWVFYKESCKAEDYTVLAGRLANVLPDLRRIYETGELVTDLGTPSGIFVKLVLVADKPFIRHVCGMLSHNADAFGAPFCTCCDAKEVCGDCDDDADTAPTGGLYDFTMDPHTHYGELSFDDLCHRAHMAPWEALGKPEPARWRFVCPCCEEVRDAKQSARGE